MVGSGLGPLPELLPLEPGQKASLPELGLSILAKDEHPKLRVSIPELTRKLEC